MAGVQQARWLVVDGWAFLIIRAPEREYRLKGGRCDGPEHFDNMCASLDAAQALFDSTPPSGADRYANEAFEVRRYILANPERTKLGHGLNIMNVQIAIDREPDPHFMNRLSRRHASALAVVEDVGLNIRQVTFYIPKPVRSSVPGTVNLSSVDVFALRWSRKWHRSVLSCCS